MARNQREIYCFLSDSSRKFYKAVQADNGIYTITKDSNPYPIKYNPSNINEAPFEFGTNSEYFSMARSIAYPLRFVKDGAAIIRDRYHNGRGGEENIYLTVIRWNGVRNLYELGYYGKLALPEKNEEPESDAFTAPTLDDSAWGVLSQNDGVEYAIDCTSRNPKAIPVLFDSIDLVNKYTYQTVQAPILQGTHGQSIFIPLVFINQDGDSVGIVTKDQTGEPTTDDPNIPRPGLGGFFQTYYDIQGMDIEGVYQFQYNNNGPSFDVTSPIGQELTSGSGTAFTLYIGSQRNLIFSKNVLVDGRIYTIPFRFTNVTLEAFKRLSFVLTIGTPIDFVSHVTITPIATNIFITTKTKAQPQIAYGLRAIDLMQQLVAKATHGRFTINSSFFAENNKDVVFGGESLRNIPNAKIYSSFKDFFDSFNFIYFMALKNVNGSIFMEKAIDVYKKTSTIIDLGEAMKVELSFANEYDVNEVEQGSPQVDLRHPSGRLEFNAPNKWAFPKLNSGKKRSLVSKYRLGCYDMQFLILDYQNESTVDNSGDKTVYVAKITDEQALALDDIETFENVSIDNIILQPIIKSPRTNDYISFSQPTITGVAPVGSTVFIFVDGALDGSTITGSEGNWIYDIANPLTGYDYPTEDGIHTIDATFGTLSDPSSTITITIDATTATPGTIIYPSETSVLYNNKPLIQGVAQAGTVIELNLDGALLATVVADGSCKWFFKSPVIPNGAHTLSIGTDVVLFTVSAFTEYPIITYIGSELDGFPIVNNLPLIEGVAIPGTVVQIWLNYDRVMPLGTVTADANGVWSYQVVPLTYIDPVSGIPVVMAPIRNGLNVFSTSLQNHIVKIQTSAYKLSRPNYSLITGVTNNSVFNTEYSPSRMFRNWNPMWASVMRKMPNEKAYFQKPGKNGDLLTVLNGVTIHESDNIPVAEMGEPIALLEKVKITVKALTSFAETLYNFNNGGEIKFTYRGYTLWGLPIGSMKINSIHDSTQQWELLLSPKTPLTTLLNLYRNGTTIKVMKNGVFHSNYNTLHVVSYDFTPNPKYHDKDLYDDWFDSRNDAWIDNPQYIQKMQRTDPLVDQIISNGVANLTLKMYRCSDAFLVDTKPYLPVTAPIPPPDVLLEARYNMNDYPADQYFFVIFTNDMPIGITERIETRSVWQGTILIEARNSTSKVGAFFYTGFQGVIRVEGLVKKRQPHLETSDTAEFESGDSELLYAKLMQRRIIRFGTAFGLPDYLYLKIADYIALDGLRIQGKAYTLPSGEKIQPADELVGHPLYRYDVLLEFKIGEHGLGMGGDPVNELNSVVLVVDGLAVGLPAGSLININYNG